MGYWRDTHLRLEGDSVYYIQYVFLKDWRLASGEGMSHPRLFLSTLARSKRPCRL